jgi:hypothetical protein
MASPAPRPLPAKLTRDINQWNVQVRNLLKTKYCNYLSSYGRTAVEVFLLTVDLDHPDRALI